MQSRWIWLFAAVFAAAITSPTGADARNIAIENARGSKVKVCSYRSDDKSVFRPRKCWMLENKETILWKRGDDESDFDLRVFGPGVFELPICMERDIGKVLRVKVSPSREKSCVTIVDRDRIAARAWQIDDHVLVNRDGDNFWYPATILGRNGGEYWLRLPDGLTAVEPAHYITSENIRAGNRIECNWKGQGRWYTGTILSRNGNRVTVKYDAGWTEADQVKHLRVASDRIGKLPQPVLD